MTTIESPILLEAQPVAGDWTAIPGYLPVPGMGVLAVNSFLLRSNEPVLVDTGLAAYGQDFLATLECLVDPADLRWIFLSHTDADHIGNLTVLMNRAPQAKLVTTFLGMGKLGMMGHAFGPDRVHLLNPGDALQIGDRRLTTVRPPYYDAPETLGFHDAKDRVFFSADSFGALLPEPVLAVDAVAETIMRDGLTTWATIDAPWLAQTDRGSFAGTLDALARLEPAALMSSHLPIAVGRVNRLIDIAQEAWGRGQAGGIDSPAVEAVAEAMA